MKMTEMFRQTWSAVRSVADNHHCPSRELLPGYLYKNAHKTFPVRKTCNSQTRELPMYCLLSVESVLTLVADVWWTVTAHRMFHCTVSYL